MAIDKTEKKNGFTTSNLCIYDRISTKRKLMTKTSKQGLLIINWTLDYIEEKSFLNILGIN